MNSHAYFQYDDLGRTSYIGEAKITVSDFFLLDPDKLAVPNASSVILTSNPTVWFKTTGNKVNKFANITVNSDYFNYNAIRTEHNIEFDSDVLEYTNGIVGPYIMHPTDYYPEITLPQDADNNFEDISQFPEFVKSAVYYDEIPPKMGYIWENMPPVEFVNKLAPKGEMQNLKGKRSVLAYRDNQDDPFHYVFFSYDARGRVESIIRWTENIGFEIVKYTYNSMNKVQFVNVIDAARQYCTWNVYDDNGRLWKVYSKMGVAGSGYDYQNQNYENIRLPVPLTRPMSPDITYSYTKRNEVDSIIYNSAGANKQIFYDPMGWVDSLIVKRDGQQIFKQILERDDMGMVIQQKSKHPTQDEKTINYTYDNLNRLTEWQNPVNYNGQTFNYDDIGNRTGSTDNGLSMSYSYNTNKNQLSEVNKGVDTTFNFEYNSYGAVTSIVKNYQNNPVKQESWEYVNSTVPKIYSKQVGSDVWTWRYMRGAFDTREQKRLVVSPLGDGGDNGDAYAQSWEYSLTGVAGEELVLYKGIQTSAPSRVFTHEGLQLGVNDQGRRVYMAMSRFFVAGTELQYLASGNKELHITDNQGNVRTIFELTYNSQIRSFDYKPFGEKEWTSNDNDRDRKGFASSEYDSESDYYAMGYRMYSAEFGRFLAVDPLFEAMPRHNPYHYSYNSPMFWSDPSGLAPVKEKVKNSERLLENEWNQGIFDDANFSMNAENGKRSAFVKSSNMGDYWCAKAMQANFSWFFLKAFNVYNTSIGDVAGTSETARSGEEAAADNGSRPGVQAIGDDAKKAVKESVENDYEKYIGFDEDGYVFFKEGYEKALSQAGENSNFYKLSELVTNPVETISVDLIGTRDFFNFLIDWGNGSATKVETTNFNILTSKNSPYTIFGIFLCSKPVIYWEGSHGKLMEQSTLGPFHSLIYADKSFSSTVHSIVAHELYYHAWRFIKNLDFRDTSGPTPKTIEYIKSNNKR